MSRDQDPDGELPKPILSMLSADMVPYVLDCAPDAMLVVDRAGTIVFSNRQVSELFGYFSVQSDPSLVSQVLRNLLSNAIKYTREAWVHLRCLREAQRVRRAIQMLLRVAGYSTTAVGSHSAALQQLERDQQLDMIIADYHLGPGETGLQVVGAVRSALGRPVKAVLLLEELASS